jgi:hypothetical protein
MKKRPNILFRVKQKCRKVRMSHLEFALDYPICSPPHMQMLSAVEESLPPTLGNGREYWSPS